MKRIKVTQVKSTIDRPERQKKTMAALGLRKMNASVEHNATPEVMGMVEKVLHLVSVEELEGSGDEKKATQKSKATKKEEAPAKAEKETAGEAAE